MRALEDLSFETREREFLSFVGPSGCGKTTLLRVLAGIMAPDEGAVERIPSAVDRNQSVLLVSQERSLFPWMTVLENAAFGCEMQGVPKREREERARELLHRLGFAGREKAYPRELSLGMKQRVAVARCFLSDPAVMLMDEPFAALDCQRRLELQQELLDLWEQNHKTVIFVTHDVEEALLLSDRILVFSRPPGRIVAELRIGLPRPRAAAITMTEEFLSLKRRIASELGMAVGQREALA
ncbi:MAG TPA: ATP-binding cassette domain-containing protein [Bryobacteraceae bacterium]|nr:ATP-binding cassette domain-containing protein [Bryobacteraceae bacterium]